MTIESVLERTEVIGFEDDTDIVFAQLRAAYTGSDRLANAIEQWLSAHPTQNIRIIHWNENNANGGPAGEGRVRINFEFPPRLVYIDVNGNAVQCDFLTVLVHELGHAIGGWFDTPTPLETMGDNVYHVNKWFEQLGIPQNVSYIAQDLIGTGSDILRG